MVTRRCVLAAGLAALWPPAAPRAAGDPALVDLLIETPQSDLLDLLVARIHAGLAPDELLTALSIAACREVSPYPDVGFKYHAVMMLQSVGLSVAALPGDRAWLPLLWTADYFKTAAGREDRDGPWSLPRRSDGAGGTPGAAALAEALIAWDRNAADRVTADLVAGGQLDSVLQTLMHYAARDFRSIGHKTITAANAHRLSVGLGNPVAAPLARSLALALQNPDGDDDPARHEYEADADWRANGPRAAKLPNDWERGDDDFVAARTLLEELRIATSDESVAAAIDLLSHGVSARTAWETVMAFAAELILRHNGILSVHASTTANAMHYCYRVSEAETSKRLLLLQAVAFMARFRDLVESRRPTPGRRIDAIDPLPAAGIEEIFTTLGEDRYRGVRQAFGWLEAGGDPAQIAERARWHSIVKNTGSHDIKFTEATIENFRWLRMPWRNALLAASLMYANAESAQSDQLITRAQALLRED